VIDQTYGSPKITKDGVTVAKAIELKDKFQNVGASLVKQVASATNDVAGDGAWKHPLHCHTACCLSLTDYLHCCLGVDGAAEEGFGLCCADPSVPKFDVVGADSCSHRCNATGTTTATVLTRAIFSEGCKSVAAGMNPMDLRRGISLAVEKVVDILKSRAKMISTTEEIAQVG
jgi:chaperonin GroEL (HSP60 family)